MPKPTPIAVRAFAVLLAVASPALRAAMPVGDAHAGALEATLAGEYALQGGQLQEAATWYLRAARAAAGDAALAERAARIALLAGDDATAAEALALWRQRAPRTLAMRAIETSLALRRGDEASATASSVALAAAPDDGWRHALGALASGGSDLERTGRVLGRLVDAEAIPPRLDPWLAFAGLAQRLDQEALAERIVDAVVRRFPQEPGNERGEFGRVIRVAPRQHLDRAPRDVAEVAYRGRDNIEARGQRFGSAGVAHTALVAHIMRMPQACWRSAGSLSAAAWP